MLLALLVGLSAGTAAAQVPDTIRTVVPADTLEAAPDTLRPGAADPAGPRFDAPAPAAPGSDGLQQPVEFSAEDSLVIVFDEAAGDRGALYGNAQVSFGEAGLKAYRVDMLFDIEELRATGLPSDTGLVGRPQFTQGQETFLGNQLAFNLRTERGRVVAAQTVLDDGFITGGVVKVTEDSTLYIQGGTYTTCECVEDPSYSLRASRMKVVDKKWVYTGPIQLYLFNIPTPFILPFGFLPAQEGRRSGPLPPRYGEDERGFYLRDWGWYWAINQFMDVQVQFGLWTKGSWQVNPLFRYARRYRYTGQLNLDYIRNRRGERGDPAFTVLNTTSLRWSHNQTLSPTANFSGNVNLSSSSYLRTVSERYDDRVRQTVESSIRYNKRWTEAGRSLGVNLNQRQVLATGQTTMTLPSLSFSQGSRKLFERDSPVTGGREPWYERITYSYNGTLDNRFDYNPLPKDTLLARGDTAAARLSWAQALFSPGLYRRATGHENPFEFSAAHTVPVSASFSMTRLPVLGTPFRMNLSTSFNYNENWYLQTQRRAYDEATRRVETTTEPGFFALRRFSSSVSANTTFYGLFPFQVWRFTGFRHTVRPSAGMSFSPDFTSRFWGYMRSYVDRDGREVEYPIVNTYPSGPQQTLNLRVDNVLETKLARTDTTGDERLTTLQLLNFDFATDYNFAADSFKLSNVTFGARTNLFDRLSLSFRSTFSPYRLNEVGRPVDDYIFSLQGFRFARLTQLSFTARTSFRSGASGPSRPADSPWARMGGASSMGAGGRSPLDPTGAFDPDVPFDGAGYNTAVGYADFAIPWSIDLDFNYNLSRPFQVATPTASLNAGFDFNLTPRWKVQGRSGYDVVRSEFVTTNLVVLRDFECWQMSFSWVPFGRYQSYSFDLHVKSGKLRDLLRIRQPRSDVRGRFEGLL